MPSPSTCSPRAGPLMTADIGSMTADIVSLFMTADIGPLFI